MRAWLTFRPRVKGNPLLSFTTLMISDVTLTPEVVAADLRPVLLRLARELRKETEQLGITARQATLLWLVKRSPGLSLAELAAEEGISPPAMSGHVDRLERAGLLERERSSDDRRRVGLRLTEDGQRLLRRIRARRTTWLADRLRTLDSRRARRGRSRRAGAPPTRRRRTRDARSPSRCARARSGASDDTATTASSSRGQLVSLAGTWMQNVALAWLVIELSGSALAIGALAFWRFVPFTLFGLVGRSRRRPHRVAQARHDDAGGGDGDLDRARRRHAHGTPRRCRSSTYSPRSAASRSRSTRRDGSR